MPAMPQLPRLATTVVRIKAMLVLVPELGLEPELVKVIRIRVLDRMTMTMMVLAPELAAMTMMTRTEWTVAQDKQVAKEAVYKTEAFLRTITSKILSTLNFSCRDGLVNDVTKERVAKRFGCGRTHNITTMVTIITISQNPYLFYHHKRVMQCSLHRQNLASQ
jgi:hypothetical protein